MTVRPSLAVVEDTLSLNLEVELPIGVGKLLVASDTVYSFELSGEEGRGKGESTIHVLLQLHNNVPSAGDSRL